MPVIGFLHPASPGSVRQHLAAFHQALKGAGYVEGQNIAIEYRWAEGQSDRLPALAADLARRQLAVLVAGSNAGALAAKQATATIPIIFLVGEDPVKLGLIASLNRPGGNMTGVYQFAGGLDAKRLGLLHELAPKAAIIAMLVNPINPGAESQVREAREAATRVGVQLVVLNATAESDFGPAFATLVRQQAGALLVVNDPFFNLRREQLTLLAARHGCRRSPIGANLPKLAAS
jgi:putative ABC transport system substrate-binding protein